MERHDCDVLVVGGGLAAMAAALEAAASGGSVLMASKGPVGRSGASVMAAANFAASLPQAQINGDSIEAHVADTLAAGCFVNDARLVRSLAEKAPQEILFLEEAGVEFLKKDGLFDLRRPPGHSHSRVVTTVNRLYPLPRRGMTITAPLRRRLEGLKIPFLSGVVVAGLVVAEGRLIGAFGIRRGTGESVALSAKAVVLAGGGGGYLYSRTTNPGGATGDSYGLALEAGGELRDMEFVQFFPCAHLVPPRVVLSSTLLSEGALLRNGRGERFLARWEPGAMEQANRDALSRAIHRELKSSGEGCVRLDMTAVPPDLLAFRFPDLAAALKERGIDPGRTWLPVAPAAHFFMGGVLVDPSCRTAVEGLFAAGEAAGGVHGANRLPGNGLSAALVFGRIAGRGAAACAAGRSSEAIPWEALRPAEGEGMAVGRERLKSLRAGIRRLMDEKAGIVRTKEGLEEALTELEGWAAELEEARPAQPGDRAAFHELRLMLLAARAVTASALARRESRGAHFREDFPLTDGARQGSVVCRLAGGRIRTRFEP